MYIERLGDLTLNVAKEVIDKYVVENLVTAGDVALNTTQTGWDLNHHQIEVIANERNITREEAAKLWLHMNDNDGHLG